MVQNAGFEEKFEVSMDGIFQFPLASVIMPSLISILIRIIIVGS